MWKFFVPLFALLPSIALAQSANNDPSPIKDSDGEFVITRHEAEAMATDAFLDTHLDIKYLLIGRKYYLDGKYEQAIRALDRSAFYGDKLSQAMLAEMYWDGKGISVDRVRAYAMADVASERMNEPLFVAMRERYWEALTPQEKDQVADIAPEILERYGQFRTDRRVEQHWRNSRNSRMAKGSERLLTRLVLDNYSTGTIIDDVRPDAFFANKFWDIESYRTFKDQYVAAAARNGTVRVKFVGAADDSPPSPHVDKSVTPPRN